MVTFFLSEVENFLGLAGTQWILISIMFGILAINSSLMSGNRAFFDNSRECYGDCQCNSKK